MQTNTAKLTEPISIGLKTQTGRQSSLFISLAITDLAGILLGFFFAFVGRFELGISWDYQPAASPIDLYQSLVFLIAPSWLFIFFIFGLYDFKNIFSGMQEYTKIFNACTLGVMFIVLLTFLYPTLTLARGWVVLSWLFTSAFVGLGRFGFRRIIQHLRGQGHFVKKAIIVGANEEGRAIADQLQSNIKAGLQIVGFVDDDFATINEPLLKIPLLGPIDSIVQVIQQKHANEVIIASTALPRQKLLELFQKLDANNVPTQLSSGLYEILTTGVEVQEIGNVPLLSINKMRLTGADTVFKRLLDLVGAVIALTIFLPLMLFITVAVKLDSSGPIIYRRRVVGAGGKLFDALKFRTMCIDADERLAKDASLRSQFQQNHKLKDDPRVTRVGRFLRRTSLDELPQLFNVLIGQMSLVGPRMITSPERDYYGKWSMNLFTVKPGMTGLWQVSGRSDVSYEERVRLDMHYIRNYSIWLDLYILWLTIPTVLQKRGAY
jgi:exopolysaccharide biosynthesis polyprenyl glycosylphosphotransferase